MEFHEILDSIMKEMGLTIPEIARKCDLTDSTVRSIFDRKQKKIALNVAFKISNGLGISLERLNGEPEKEDKKTEYPNDDEWVMLKKYRLLDPYGQEAVDGVLDVEWRRCIEEEAARLRDAQRQAEMESAGEIAPTIDMIVYDNPAAAGTPLYAESEFERIPFPADEIPGGTDFGIRISGRSMEPTVKDGSIVWVHKTLELQNGSVGVFMLNDSAVCKRFFKNEDGTIRLESDNTEFGPVSISEFDELIPVGEVLAVT